jgi:hypothetical protein
MEENTREISLRTYNKAISHGMLDSPMNWHIWKRAFDVSEIEFKKINNKDKRIKELEEAAMELYNLVHESDLIENKIKANDLYEIIKTQIK